MNDTIINNKKTPAWFRIGLGGLLLAASLAGLIVTATTFLADYQYNKLNKVRDKAQETVNDKQFLTQYALRLERLLALDPTNGEIRSQYASVCGRLGDYEKAINNLEQAKQTFNTQSSLSFLADMYERIAGQYEGRAALEVRMDATREAETMMADCVKINPNDPVFHPMRLRILNKQLIDLKALQKEGKPVDEALYQATSRTYGEAAENWTIRAPHDKNAYLFMGQYYVELKNYLYAYRSYLIGLSQASWLTLNRKEAMIEPQAALGTVSQILNGHYAKEYKGLPPGILK